MYYEQGWSNEGSLEGSCTDGNLSLTGTERSSYYVRAPSTPGQSFDQDFSDTWQAIVTGTVSGERIDGTLSWEGSGMSHSFTATRE